MRGRIRLSIVLKSMLVSLALQAMAAPCHAADPLLASLTAEFVIDEQTPQANQAFFHGINFAYYEPVMALSEEAIGTEITYTSHVEHIWADSNISIYIDSLPNHFAFTVPMFTSATPAEGCLTRCLTSDITYHHQPLNPSYGAFTSMTWTLTKFERVVNPPFGVNNLTTTIGMSAEFFGAISAPEPSAFVLSLLGLHFCPAIRRRRAA